MSVNKVTLLGNLGKDADITTFNNGGSIAALRLATTFHFSKRNGEKSSRTEWHNIVIRNSTIVERIGQYLTKGTEVYIEGMLETRDFTGSDGIKRYTTEIVVRPYVGDVQLVGGRQPQAQGQKPSITQYQNPSPVTTNSPHDGNEPATAANVEDEWMAHEDKIMENANPI